MNRCFDTPIDRRGTNCYKYDTMPYPDTIPLWVAFKKHTHTLLFDRFPPYFSLFSGFLYIFRIIFCNFAF